ncbi:hypothetical protein VTN00DRAFT_1103 [Thermoascus crustaceus]|uniref:uncharacterized protein n=1 Tax=Thermoascus crustaceus TaxID=5088 RepID=UPI0037445AD7
MACPYSVAARGNNRTGFQGSFVAESMATTEMSCESPRQGRRDPRGTARIETGQLAVGHQSSPTPRGWRSYSGGIEQSVSRGFSTAPSRCSLALYAREIFFQRLAACLLSPGTGVHPTSTESRESPPLHPHFISPDRQRALPNATPRPGVPLAPLPLCATPLSVTSTSSPTALRPSHSRHHDSASAKHHIEGLCSSHPSTTGALRHATSSEPRVAFLNRRDSPFISLDSSFHVFFIHLRGATCRDSPRHGRSPAHE